MGNSPFASLHNRARQVTVKHETMRNSESQTLKNQIIKEIIPLAWNRDTPPAIKQQKHKDNNTVFRTLHHTINVKNKSKLGDVKIILLKLNEM